jgi:hypothetical protein
MSSRTTEPVQPDAATAGDTGSPAEIVEIVDADATPEPGQSPDSAPGAEAGGDGGTGDPDGPDGPDGSDGSDGRDAVVAGVESAAVEPPAAEPPAVKPPAADGSDGGDGRDGSDGGVATDETEAVEAGEPTELIEMSEPVELAEPVELTGPPGRGHGLAIAGAFLVMAVLIIGAAIGIVGALTHGFRKPAPIVTYKTSPVFGLRTGECLNASGQRFALVSCSVPHDAEVFATFRLTGASWPGTPKVRTAASAGCQSRLAGYLNPQLALSLASTYVFPGQVAWQAGTRTVICEVRPTSGQLTGSVRAGAASPA